MSYTSSEHEEKRTVLSSYNHTRFTYREPTPDCACCRKSIQYGWGAYKLPSGMIYLCNGCSGELCAERLNWAKWRLKEEGWTEPKAFAFFKRITKAKDAILHFFVKIGILEYTEVRKLPVHPIIRD